MHRAGIEEQRPTVRLGVSAMRVPENNRVSVWKAPAERQRQRLVWMQIAQAQCPQQRLRLFHPPAPVAVDENDSTALDGQLASQRQPRQSAIVVAAHRLDRRDALEGGNRLRAADVTGVQDEIDPPKNFENTIWKAIEELRAVCVGHDANPCAHAGVRVGCDLIVSNTTSGARLSTAPMAKITGCPRPNATAPSKGPMTPPT